MSTSTIDRIRNAEVTGPFTEGIRVTVSDRDALLAWADARAALEAHRFAATIKHDGSNEAAVLEYRRDLIAREAAAYAALGET